MPSRNYHLQKIKIQRLYLDTKSLEETTLIIKRKYKLAGTKLLNVYTFFVGTSKQYTCNASQTLCIAVADWEQLKPGYLNEPHTFFDVSRIESFDEDDLLAKITDPDNRFLRIANLPNSHFQQLQDLCKKAHSPSLEKKVLMQLAVDVIQPSAIAADLLQKLGL